MIPCQPAAQRIMTNRKHYSNLTYNEPDLVENPIAKASIRSMPANSRQNRARVTADGQWCARGVTMPTLKSDMRQLVFEFPESSALSKSSQDVKIYCRR